MQTNSALFPLIPLRSVWLMQAVKQALQIPVLANGNIRNINDVDKCLEATGADGVMSAESLLGDPALFWSERRRDDSKAHLEGCRLLLEYLDIWESYPVPFGMVRGHAFKMLGEETLNSSLACGLAADLDTFSYTAC